MTRLIWQPAIAHTVAMSAALFFAWIVWQSPFSTSALQFVTPLLLVMGVHFLWLAGGKALQRGYAVNVLGRSAATGALLVLVLLLGTIFAPMPAEAQAEEVFGLIFGVLGCVLMIAAVIAIPGFIIWGLAKLIFRIIDGKKSEDEDDDDQFLNDGGTLIFIAGLIAFASLEGVTERLTRTGANEHTASVVIAAPVDAVWATMQTATSPEFPLPKIMQSLPQPVAVTTDEGTDLHAMRVVAFQGREGAGALTLQVVERSETQARFALLSDTTPYAGWIGFDTLTYTVLPTDEGTALSVSLEYERKLSPSWFFEPVMAGVARLSMDVLARDVKARTEASQ